MSLPRRTLLAGTAGLAGCAALPPPRACPAAATGLSVIARSWHTEIAVPVAAMGSFADTYRGATVLLFGFGKRSFMISPARGPAEWLAGPFSGPGVMQVTALNAPPEAAMDAAILALPIDTPGMRKLTEALWDSFRIGPGRHPVFVSRVRGSDFYEAARDYSLDYTCNAWTAETLALAGFPVRPEGVLLSGEVMRQVAALPGACRAR